nr:MAG TPA: hypothetical protein [Microviridae sp.]
MFDAFPVGFVLFVLLFIAVLSLYFIWLIFSLLRHTIAALKIWISIYADQYKSDYERYYKRKRDERK